MTTELLTQLERARADFQIVLADFEAIEHHITRLADLLDEAIRNPSPENRPHLENIARMLNYLRDRANAVAAAFWQQQDEGPVQ